MLLANCVIIIVTVLTDLVCLSASCFCVSMAVSRPNLTKCVLGDDVDGEYGV